MNDYIRSSLLVCGTKMSENPTYPESEGKNDAHIQL